MIALAILMTVGVSFLGGILFYFLNKNKAIYIASLGDIINLATCLCGKKIRRCEHTRGVPSTWEHASWPHIHYHSDRSMVEHA